MNLLDGDIVKTEEGLIFNPYNQLNIKVSRSDIETILKTYNIPPFTHNIELYQRAFVHVSYTKRPDYENRNQNIKIVECPPDCIPLSTKSNERLEFLGDGILEAVVKYYLYRRFPKADEGFMTNKKIMLVKNESIGRIAYEMGLNKWLLISKHSEEKGNRTNLKKLGCLFEAFIGALFLDFNKFQLHDEEKWFEELFVCGPGFQMAQKFIENILEKHVDWEKLIMNDDNYKNLLQVRIQKEFKVTPEYLIIENNTEIGYKMGVYLCLGQKIHSLLPENAENIENYHNFQEIKDQLKQQGKLFLYMGCGQHKIKIKAEQIACQIALSITDKYK
jgi:dsRNA-specific ribonuclease